MRARLVRWREDEFGSGEATVIDEQGRTLVLGGVFPMAPPATGDQEVAINGKTLTFVTKFKYDFIEGMDGEDVDADE